MRHSLSDAPVASRRVRSVSARMSSMDTSERVGHVVVADLNAQRQAKEQAAYDLLREI